MITDWITASASVGTFFVTLAFFFFARREMTAIEKLYKEVNKVTPGD